MEIDMNSRLATVLMRIYKQKYGNKTVLSIDADDQRVDGVNTGSKVYTFKTSESSDRWWKAWKQLEQVTTGDIVEHMVEANLPI